MDGTMLTFGVFLSLLGTGLTALLSLLGMKGRNHRLSMILLVLSTGLGAVTGSAFLFSGLSTIALSQSVWLFGASFALHPLSAIFFLILNAVACLASIYAIRYVELYGSIYNIRTLDALMALFVLGMQGVLLAGSPFAFLVFWEVMSVSSFFLVMADKEPASIRSALFYLIMTHLGAGAILAGFMLVSGGSWLDSFAMIASNISQISPSLLTTAFVLFLFGFGSKAGLVPFHVWLPEAHPQAPSHISALMSGVMLKMALYGFLLVMFSIFPSVHVSWAMMVLVLGLLSGLYGVLYAVLERDVKRMLAFSSIENMGILFTMIGMAMLAKTQGLSDFANIAIGTAIFFAIAHALFKSGLFMGAGIMVHAAHTRSLEAMGGLAKRMPAFAGSVLILALGAAALPPLSAFVGEWTFVQSLVSLMSNASKLMQTWSVVVVSMFALFGGLALFAMVKLFGIGFLAEPRTEHVSHAKAPSASLAFPIHLLAVATVLLGVGAPFVYKLVGWSNLTSGFILDSAVAASGFSLNMISILGVLIAAFLLTALARYVMSDKKNERLYHTWNCGQPITSGMEYTATAFSSPIRFFFRMITQTKKRVIVTPVVETNPWIAKRTFSLELRQLWYDWLYQPIIRFFLFLSTRIRRLQNGVIQFYIALILLALVVSLTTAL